MENEINQNYDLDQKTIAQLVEQKDNVLQVIQAMRDSFDEVYKKWNPMDDYRDVDSFYLTGHCASFARALTEIFGESAMVYDTHAYVITKIGNNYYDVLGDAYGEHEAPREGGTYRECPIEHLGMVENVLTTSALHDRDIRDDLVIIGKKKLYELAKNLNPEETHHKSM